MAVSTAAITACSWLPPDSPPAKRVPPDPDAPLLHTWRVGDHILGSRALISDADATGFRDRTVGITATGYSSPWSGACDDARHGDRQPRTAAEVATAHDIAATQAASLGLGEPIVEYQLSCASNRTPALTLYVAGNRAVTCWSGVCYLLAR